MGFKMHKIALWANSNLWKFHGWFAPVGLWWAGLLSRRPVVSAKNEIFGSELVPKEPNVAILECIKACPLCAALGIKPPSADRAVWRWGLLDPHAIGDSSELGNNACGRRKGTHNKPSKVCAAGSPLWCVSLHPYYPLLPIVSTGIRAPIQALRRFVQASGAVQGGPV